MSFVRDKADAIELAANDLLEVIIKGKTPNVYPLINDVREQPNGIQILEKLRQLIILRDKEDKELLISKYSHLRKMQWNDSSEKAQELRREISRLEPERYLLGNVRSSVEVHLPKDEHVHSVSINKP